MSAKWYTLWTKTGCEKKVVACLKKKNIEAYCPLKKVHIMWSIRKHDLQPLLPNYVFVKMEDSQRDEVKSISGVINFMYWLNEPAVVKDREIEMLKKLTTEYDNIMLEKVPVNKPLIKVADGYNSTLEHAIPRKKVIKAALPSLGYILSVTVKEEVVAEENVAYLYPNYQYTDAI